MQLQVKRRPGVVRFLTESGATAAEIRRDGGERRVCDGQGRTVYLARAGGAPGSRWYALVEDGRTVASATPVFDAAPALLPPRAAAMEVRTPWGVWQVRRRRDCGAEILRDGVLLGETTPFFSPRPQWLTCDDRQPPVFWAGLYALIDYMMHEDDVDVV